MAKKNLSDKLKIAILMAAVLPLAFTLPASAQVPPPTFSKAFSPNTIFVDGTSTLSFTIDNTAGVAAAGSLAFTDNLPAGVVIENPSGATTTCTGGTITAVAGGGTITYSGGSVAAGAACTVSVDVTSSVSGTMVNTSGDLTSDAGNSGTASDTLFVDDPGRIIIDKVTVPPGDPTSFDFTLMDEASTEARTVPAKLTQNFSLADGDTPYDSGPIPPGTYDVSETVPSGWELTDATCDNEDSPGSIFVSAGQTVTCTFTNLKPSDVGFSKSFLPDSIGPGSTTTLRFDIDNSESATLVTDIAFTDVLPAGIIIATPAGAFTDCANGVLSAPDGGTTISLTGGTLGPNSACSVSADVIGISTATNTSGDLTSSDGSSGAAVAALTVDTARPGFSKAFAPGSIPLGGTSTLTFTIDNTANATDLGRLEFSDPLPAGMIIATPPNASTDCGGSFGATFTADPGTSSISLLAIGFLPSFPVLDAGSTCTATVDVTTSVNGTFHNTSGELIYLSSTGDTAGFATAALDVPIEFLNKVFLDDPVPPGGSVTLQFTIHNPSRTGAATSIAFDDPLPAGLTFSSLNSDDCGGILNTATPDFLAYSGGSLTAEGSCTVVVTLSVPPGASPGTYTNTTTAITATIDGDGVTGNMATDELTVSLAPTFKKEFLTNPVGAGGTTTLRFTLTNNSTTSSLSDIAFEDVFDDVLPTASVVPANPVCNGGAAIFTPFFDGSGGSSNTPAMLTVTGASLGASESCTIEITLDVVTNAAAGIFPNITSTITALLGGEEPVEGFPASDDLVVVGGPSLIKEFTDDPVDAGGTVTLKFTLTHSEFAAGDATNITFSDDLAAALAGLTAVGPLSTGTCTGTLTSTAMDTSLLYEGGTLAPGESCAFSVTLDVPASAAPGAHTNTTSILTATVSGVAVTGNPASDDLRIAGLTLTKEFLDDPVIPGDTVTLEFVIENVSMTETATSITIRDDMATILGGSPDITGDGVPVADVCGPGNGTVAWSAGDTFMTFSGGALTPGEMCTFSVILTVPAAAASDTYVNTTGDGGQPGFFASMPSLIVFDEATDDLIVSSDLLFFTKEFTDDPVAPGGTVTLEFTLTNQADEAVSDIEFTDDLEVALAGLLASGLPISACGGTVSTPDGGSTIELAGGSLAASGAAGDSCTFSLTLQVPPDAALGSTATNTTGEVSGTLGVEGPVVTGGPAIDELRISTLDFTKAFDDVAIAGGTVVLTFTIGNLDPSSGVSRIEFSDDLDLVITGLEATGLPVPNVCGPGSVLAGTSVISLGGGSLGPGASCTFDVTLQVPLTAVAGTYTNITGTLLVDSAPAGVPATADLVIELETVPPTVTVVDSDAGTGDGMVEECETTQVQISKLFVTFSESVQDPPGDTDPDDVTNPANYLVIAAGPDADFSTAACGTVFGDDVPVPILGVSYDDPSATATLTLSGPLPGSQIRLMVCGSTSIYDLVGNPLDGNGNGTGGDDFVLTFRSDPFNLLTNGHFDCVENGWVLTSATPGEIFHSPTDSDNSSVSGSLEFMQLGINTMFSAEQCVQTSSGTKTDLTGLAQVSAGGGVQLSLTAGCTSFASTDCSDPSLGTSSTTAILGDSGGSWQPIALTVNEQPGRQSILCSFMLSVPNGDNFSLRLDQAILGASSAIFADDFESGDTSAWSTTVGGSP